jgi:molybdenum cofactor guanylyltransferase
MRRGAIILCGGRSSRLGTDKALLPFGSETMLERVVRIVDSVIDPQQIVIVAAANQQLPPLRENIVRDNDEYQGPLLGIACGFATLPPATEAVFVTGCDTPFISPALIEFLFAQLGDANAVVPQDAERLYPLCAVYRTNILKQIERHLATGQRSLHKLVEEINANHIAVDLLREVDPQLLLLRNINTWDEYHEALAAVGLSTP